jgi:hypothetical protein
VDGHLSVRAHEEVLASRHDLADGPAGQIRGREAGNAEVRPCEDPSRERLVHPCRGREHGVAFCHPDIIRDRSGTDLRGTPRSSGNATPSGTPILLHLFTCCTAAVLPCRVILDERLHEGGSHDRGARIRSRVDARES